MLMADTDRSARLDDPAGHFPYKLNAAYDVLEDPPDDLEREHPHLTAEVVEAAAAMVAAQQAHLADPADPEARDAYDQAKDDLVIARQFHRSGRTGLTATGNAGQQD